MGKKAGKPGGRSSTSTRARPAPSRTAPAAKPKPAPAKSPPSPSLLAPTRISADLPAALVTTVAAALVFLSTFSGHVALGDAPESVAGIRTLGVLHAPGYASYVLAARAFGAIVPFGSWAFRVNLFSVVCGSITIGVVYLLARRFGAGAIGAAIGALSLATAASFWFNAAFAKHYAFSALLVATAALLVVLWEEAGRGALLVGAAALLGASIGASWELGAIMLVGLVAFVWAGERRPSLGLLFGAAAAAVLVVAGVLVFVVVRARQDPTLNWGDATTFQHLRDLLLQKDFALGSQSTSNGASVSARLPDRGAAYVAVLVRDLGAAAIVLGVIGACFVVRRAGRSGAWFLGIVGVGNLLAAAAGSGLEHIAGFQSGLIVGGFLIDVFIVSAILVALGASEVIDRVVAWASGQPATLRKYRLTPGRVRGLAVAALVLVTIVPSIVVHYPRANHRMPPYTDRYAQRVLAALPPNAVLVVGGYGWGLPMVYRQLIDRDRPDVTVIDGDMATTLTPWYTGQLTRRFDLGSTLRPAEGLTPLIRLLHHFGRTRPIFLDTTAMGIFRDAIGYRAHGFVAEFVDGTGSHPADDLDATAAALLRADADDGVTSHRYSGFPNETMYVFHERAHFELAKQYFAKHDFEAVARELAIGDKILANPNATLAIQHIRDNQVDSTLTDIMKAL